MPETDFSEQSNNYIELLLNDEKVWASKELTPEEIEKAKSDQQLLTKLVEKIENGKRGRIMVN